MLFIKDLIKDGIILVLDSGNFYYILTNKNFVDVNGKVGGNKFVRVEKNTGMVIDTVPVNGPDGKRVMSIGKKIDVAKIQNGG